MNLRITYTLFLCWFLMMSCNNQKPGYNITDFGAKGDSLTINTKFIQSAIDKCAENGGGTVFIKKGIFISGTILLKSNVKLHVSENAKLVGSSNPRDYISIDGFVDATGQERGNCLIGAKNATNIGVLGKGIIDGNGIAFTYKKLQEKIKVLNLNDEQKKGFGRNRPFLLRFVKSSNINLKDINLRQPAAWTCHFYQSNSILVDNVKIYSHSNHNNDGIDIDSSYDVIIKNCDIDTGDDAVCVKTTSPKPSYNIDVSNCNLKSDWGAIKFGTESMGDFYNINIKDCKIYDTKGGGIKLLSVDGANMHNVTIDNIEMQNVDMPIFIRLGERLRTYRNAEKQDVGSIKNVTIKNIKATTRDLKNSRVSSPTGVFITGTPNHKIESITLENIDITLPGSEDNLVLKPVLENEKAYPEFNFFKVLPANGLFGRHINKLNIKNLKFTSTSNDVREEIVLEDVVRRLIN
ncbi:glycoside hydrolase family 28 protein [Polaribacter sp. SA4-12]|uniref:glycoside hydrolase family 28 protein n=1 Tax=Polaribacter sp. SA4-12 TaxID=1312072 RepID=UPI000B3D2C7C|nr:glycosyl hydrolase family 28 protein [Polaribacter sp. SA4-12]ARV16574.1 glycoside hydrolase [Polaribacter sp. SA4-12]